MDIMCLGLMVCDILVKPITREILDRDSVLVDFVKMSSGGDAFNVAVNLKKIGISSGIAGKVGRDGFGRFLIETANDVGLDTCGIIQTDECGTSTSIVMIHPDGERTFAFYPGASFQLREEDLDFKMLENAPVLYIGSAFGLPGLDGDGMASLLDRARTAGIKTVMDVTSSPDRDKMKILEPSIKYLDIFIPSYQEARGLTGLDRPEDIACDLHEKGVGLVVIKLGSKGCFISGAGQSFFMSTYDVPVVDTTGAGDAFVSGFLAAYSSGFSLMECARFANAAGSLSVMEVGATSGMKPMKDILRFMETTEVMGL